MTVGTMVVVRTMVVDRVRVCLVVEVYPCQVQLPRSLAWFNLGWVVD